MKKILTLLILVVTLSGCSVQTKKVSTSGASKVTVAVALPNQLALGTIGTTIFSNKSMTARVSGTPLTTRIRNIANKQISGAGKIQLVKSNGSLDRANSVKRNGWSGKPEIQNKAALMQKARSLGANYLLLITGKDTQEPFYGTNGYINDIGVIQRSIFGLKRANAFAALNMHVFDTATGNEASTYYSLSKNPRDGKPWITPQNLPKTNEVEEIIAGLSLENEISKGLAEMGLR